jgi:hypothetical protein
MIAPSMSVSKAVQQNQVVFFGGECLGGSFFAFFAGGGLTDTWYGQSQCHQKRENRNADLTHRHIPFSDQNLYWRNTDQGILHDLRSRDRVFNYLIFHYSEDLIQNQPAKTICYRSTQKTLAKRGADVVKSDTQRLQPFSIFPHKLIVDERWRTTISFQWG